MRQNQNSSLGTQTTDFVSRYTRKIAKICQCLPGERRFALIDNPEIFLSVQIADFTGQGSYYIINSDVFKFLYGFCFYASGCSGR